MAYRFDGVDDEVKYALAPLDGYVLNGPLTIAAFLKRGGTGTGQFVAGVNDSGSSRRSCLRFESTDKPSFQIAGSSVAESGGAALTSTSLWYLVVVTWPGSVYTARFHVHDGTSWTHSYATAAPVGSGTLASPDWIATGFRAGSPFNGDLVCAGIKKAASTDPPTADAAVEALTRTSFQSWLDYGFDWLVGFETSGALQDRSSAGTGDETARTGTTLVSDPAGWAWPASGDTTAPTVPAGLGATAASDTQINLSWTASTDAVGVTGYKLERKTGAGAFAEVATPSGTSHSDTGLTPATAYTYRVRATDAAGNQSGYSSEASATTDAAPDTAAPSDPSGLSAERVATDEIQLDWAASTDAVGVDEYRIERKTGAGSFTQIATTASTTYTDTGLPPATAYTYRVRAADAAGNVSGYTGEASAATPAPAPGPGIRLAPSSSALTASPSWVRIDTTYNVQSWSIDRGRPNEMSRTDTGTASIELVDKTGDFDPTNFGGAFHELTPMTPAAISLQNPATDEWATLFRGFVAQIRWVPYRSEQHANVTLDLVDGFAFLAACEMAPDGSFGNAVIDGNIVFNEDQDNLEAVRTRIRKALDQAGWPLSLATIFTGNVALQETVYAPRSTVLSVIQDAADAEFPDVSNVWIGGPRNTGEVVFHGRFARFHPDVVQYDITTWQAGDDAAAEAAPATVVRISPPLVASLDDTTLYTSALSTPQNVNDGDIADQYVTDEFAAAEKGLRTWSAENLATFGGDDGRTALEETKLFADYVRDNYATPRVRIGQLTIKSRRPSSEYAAATWALLCGIDISDIVHLTTTHGGGGGFDTDFYVEGIHYQARPGGGVPYVELVLDVSPRGYYDHEPDW